MVTKLNNEKKTMVNNSLLISTTETISKHHDEIIDVINDAVASGLVLYGDWPSIIKMTATGEDLASIFSSWSTLKYEMIEALSVVDLVIFISGNENDEEEYLFEEATKSGLKIINVLVGENSRTNQSNVIECRPRLFRQALRGVDRYSKQNHAQLFVRELAIEWGYLSFRNKFTPLGKAILPIRGKEQFSRQAFRSLTERIHSDLVVQDCYSYECKILVSSPQGEYFVQSFKDAVSNVQVSVLTVVERVKILKKISPKNDSLLVCVDENRKCLVSNCYFIESEVVEHLEIDLIKSLDKEVNHKNYELLASDFCKDINLTEKTIIIDYYGLYSLVREMLAQEKYNNYGAVEGGIRLQKEIFQGLVNKLRNTSDKKILNYLNTGSLKLGSSISSIRFMTELALAILKVSKAKDIFITDSISFSHREN